MRPARHYSELIVWQLADEIRRDVFKLTKRPPFARDFKAQGQADDAINSVCRNIAEGFACETHGEFATFLVYSVRSLNEVQDAMRGAEEKGYADAKDLALIRQLFKRLFPALGRFIAYLRRTRNRRRNTQKTSPKDGSPRTDQRQSNRTDERRPTRTDKRKDDRTNQRQNNRTDSRKEDRTASRQNPRTDNRKGDRIDKR
jgi:four helix bundle protein